MNVRFGPFTIDAQARRLARSGASVHLSPKAFDLLVLLIERRPAVVEKSACRERLWPGVHVVDAALSNLVAEIRAALKDGATDDAFVRTAHGVGYAFAADATAVTAGRGQGEGHPIRFWLVWNNRPLPLSSGDHVVGRDAACSVWVDEEGVSRRHARLRIPRDDQLPHRTVTIEDLGSTNGTYVQGRRTTGEAPLRNGDRVRLGDATLIFRSQMTDAPTKRVKRSRT